MSRVKAGGSLLLLKCTIVLVGSSFDIGLFDRQLDNGLGVVLPSDRFSVGQGC